MASSFFLSPSFTTPGLPFPSKSSHPNPIPIPIPSPPLRAPTNLFVSSTTPTLPFPSKPSLPIPIPSPPLRPPTKLFVSSPSRPSAVTSASERVFFDGGAHYGDLVANLLLGFTLLWLPLTLAAVSRAFFLRYRFTNLRVTVISGLTGQDRCDFTYGSIQDVKVVPRFIGEWGDIVITLKDGTKVDLRSVPKFREIADFCLFMADGTKLSEEKMTSGPKGF